GPATRRDPAALVAAIRTHAITHVLCLPSLYALVLEAGAASGGLPSLRVAIVAGEGCPAALLARHDAVVPAARLYNEYGPTEGRVWSRVYAPPRGTSPASVPIARPIANSAVYVLDARQQPVPVGVVGELYLGGAGVARGYWRRPEQ